MKHLNRQPAWLTLIGAASLAAASHAQTLEVIFCEIPTSPKSVVPGALDTGTSLPEATNFRALENIIVSPDGSQWIVTGRTQQGSDEELIMIRGSGATGTMWLQEGQPVPGGVPGELIEFFGSGLGRFDSTNRFAMTLRARGGVASVFQKVMKWDGSTWSIPIQMGDLYTGLIDIPTNVSGDETVGNSVGSAHLLDDGRIGLQDSTIGSISSTKRPAIFYDTTMFHQTNQTSVTALGGVGSTTWTSLSANSFYTTPDGAHWIALGANGTSIDLLAYDGAAVIEENKILPTTAITVGGVFQIDLAANGDWFARGRDNSSTSSTAPDWAVRSGVLIAQTGDAISGTENYGDTFLAFTGNAVGDWVLAANTDEPDAARNEVIVWNGVVVAREGDPVDIDGNGLFDDGAFLGRATPTLTCFQANDLVLTDSNTLYFLASINDGMGNDLNSSPSFGTPDVFIRVNLAPGGVITYCTAGTTSNGCLPAISGNGTPSASAGSGFSIDAMNVEGQRAGLLFYGVNGPNAASWGAGSTSFLCVKSPLRRMGTQSTGGTSNACDGALSEDWNLFIANNPGALGQPFGGGETVWAQGWFRDPPAVKTTNLTDGLQFVVQP